jgi:hypothetical protein
MRRLLPAVCCVLAFSTAADAQMPMMERARGITVAGTGTVVGEPDKARVQLTVQKSNPLMERARADTIAVVERFLALTKKLGIDPKKVRTTSALVNPEYRWDKDTGQPVLTGYLVQRQLEVEVTDLDKLGPLIEGAVSSGVNNVSPPKLDSSKRRELNRQALSAAARDAEANARAVAETLGVRVGALREFVAADAAPLPPPVPMPMARMEAAAASMDSGGSSYSPGSMEFEARVTATFDVAGP